LQQDGPNDPFGFKNSVLGQEAGKAPFFQANTSPSSQGFQLPPDLLSSMVSASHDSQWAGLQFAHASPKAMSSLERSTSSMTVGMNPTMEKSEVHAGLKTGDQGKGQQDSGQRQNQGRPGSTPSPNGAEGAGDASSKARKEAGDASRTAKGQESSNLSKQIDRVRLVQRVSSAFRSFAHQNGTVRIKLHPQELGSVTVRLQMQQGAMTAHLETETEAVQKALMENLPDLRERLGQQNIKIEHFQVEVVGQQTGGTSSQAGRERGGKGGERSAESLKRTNAPSRRSAERGEQEPARPSREESPSDPARQLDVRI
jgi:flagellar hook-length control protein FliK